MPQRYIAGVALPLGLVVIILAGDYLEGPRTAWIGVLTAIPFISAIFVSALTTLAVGTATWLMAFAFGQFLSTDGTVPAQGVRLAFIAVAVVGAVFAAYLRSRLELRAQHAREAEALAALALVDPLTRLANRRGAEQWIAAAEPRDRWVLMCDADRLKAVNDTYGHEYGDRYLSAIAGRLRSHVPGSDLVARWGGDEFLIIVPATSNDPAKVGRRLLDAVRSDPVSFRGEQVWPGMSVGIATWKAQSDVEAAVRHADEALYAAKRRGPGLVALEGEIEHRG